MLTALFKNWNTYFPSFFDFPSHIGHLSVSWGDRGGQAGLQAVTAFPLLAFGFRSGRGTCLTGHRNAAPSQATHRGACRVAGAQQPTVTFAEVLPVCLSCRPQNLSTREWICEPQPGRARSLLSLA